jgi:hypothetical protein
MKNKFFPKWKYPCVGVLSSAAFFFAFGIPTDVIPNPWFVRMIEVTFLDFFFLLSTSVLLGAYVGVSYHKKNNIGKCDTASVSGGIGGFLAFGCPICNTLLVFLFGTSALLMYLEPYRPLLGWASIAVLSGALYWRITR